MLVLWKSHQIQLHNTFLCWIFSLVSRMLFRGSSCAALRARSLRAQHFSHFSCSEVIETLSEHPTPSSSTSVKNKTCGEAGAGLTLEFVTTRAEFSSQLVFRTSAPSLSMFGEKPLLSGRKRRLDRPFMTEICLKGCTAELYSSSGTYLPTELMYSFSLCCRDVAALLRPGLSWVVCFINTWKATVLALRYLKLLANLTDTS